MLIVYLLVLIAFAWTPVHLLIRYWRGKGTEQRPGPGAVAGILCATATMLAYIVVLIANKQFF